VPPNDLLLSFFLATAVFAFVPGPGMLYAVAQTLAAGRRAGWRSALGFHLAGYLQIAAAAGGLSALLTAVPALFAAFKLLGAAYLIYLGLRYLLGGRRTLPQAVQPPGRSGRRALRDSFVVELLNPKSALFYLAFLPQFTDPTAAYPLWLQVAILGAAVNLLFSVSDAVLIETAHALASRLRRSASVIRRLRQVGGWILIGLGLHIALQKNP